MTPVIDRLPTALAEAHEVSQEEYARLLGYPPDLPLEGRALAAAKASRHWYGQHGRPWIHAREASISAIEGDRIEVGDGVLLTSATLARRLRRTGAESLIVAAVSAGGEVDARAADLWRDERLDEAYFLDRFAAAVVEHLAVETALALRAADSASQPIALPGYSPGYDGWPLVDQAAVHRLLACDAAHPLPGPLSVLESGMLAPKSSLLAVFGMTRKHQKAEAAWQRGRCSWCSMLGCTLRDAAQ